MHLFIRKSEKGAGALFGNPWTLVSCDGGSESTGTRDITLQRIVPDAAAATPPAGPHRRCDPSLCIQDCLPSLRSYAPLAECASAPRYLNEWVLPLGEKQRLISEGAGLAPDIVYARGVPNLTPPPLHSYTPRQCSLLLVEVGFRQDLRLQTKEQLKLGKYEALVQALQRRWGRVKLIGIP